MRPWVRVGRAIDRCFPLTVDRRLRRTDLGFELWRSLGRSAASRSSFGRFLSAAAGTSHHQVRVNGNQAGPNLLADKTLAQHGHGLESHVVGWQGDGGEGRIEDGGDFHIPESYEGDIARNGETALSQCADDSDGERLAGDEERRRRLRPV
jgi:hypothetical protein